jgi:hypothetical protein
MCLIFFILELVITCRFVAKLDKPKILCKNCVGAVNKSRPRKKSSTKISPNLEISS